jgi:hypothetical protein
MLSISLACAYLGWRYRKIVQTLFPYWGMRVFLFFSSLCVGVGGGWVREGAVYVECLVFLLHDIVMLWDL